MKHTSKLTIAILLFGILAASASAQVYKIVDLGIVGTLGEATGLDEGGDVVGGYCLDQGCNVIHPFLWTHSIGLQDLGTLANGGSYGFGNGLNDLIEVVGDSDFTQPFAGNTHAFLWRSAAGMIDLGTLGCPDITGASGINRAGQVVGTSTIEPCSGGGTYRAFLWTSQDGMQDLGTLPGGIFSVGEGINASGDAVGYSDCSGCTGFHAVLWSSGTSQNLGALSGGSESAARGINSSRLIVGDSDSTQSSLVHAFAWTASDGMQDLGTLPGGIWSSAGAVNDCGEIVGSSDSQASAFHKMERGRNGRPVSSGSHAFIWTDRKHMQDLNNLIIPAQSGWILVEARAINSSGQIAGIGTFEGETHGFLLNPTGHRQCKVHGSRRKSFKLSPS